MAFLVAAAANILLVLMLLRLASGPPAPPPPRNPVLVDLLPEPTTTPTADKQATRQKKAGRKTPEHPPTPTAPSAETKAQPPAALAGPLKMVIVTPDVFRASDISKLPQHPANQSQSASDSDSADAGSAGDSTTDGPGTGPHGEPLYNAEWFREPTDAELSFYLHSRPPDGGWALIACRTAARYHVEDCIEIGDSPPGSGLARSMRQAAWQFLVRPPRVGGRSLVGAWVRIRIDFTQAAQR